VFIYKDILNTVRNLTVWPFLTYSSYADINVSLSFLINRKAKLYFALGLPEYYYPRTSLIMFLPSPHNHSTPFLIRHQPPSLIPPILSFTSANVNFSPFPLPFSPLPYNIYSRLFCTSPLLYFFYIIASIFYFLRKVFKYIRLTDRNLTHAKLFFLVSYLQTCFFPPFQYKSHVLKSASSTLS
jgi:hypothetical protein